ncbi:MAG: aldehyde-activating protein [Deltaproteobacteria bacterium]|nr:aldehyde-activating protein [Deltaproteobacteria bacterium]
MCRKWGGGPLLAIECKENVIFSNDDLVSIFSSSDWAERGFCSKCGSHLFYKLKDRSDYYIPAGLLNSDIQLNFDHQVFIDEKPSYYCFSNETRNRTGAEIFAEFGG